MPRYLHKPYWALLARNSSIIRKWALKASISLEFPSALYFEPTNACNANCVFCPRKEGGRKTGYMELGLFRRLIDESLMYGRRKVIGLQKDGEPLLHEDVIAMIGYVKEKKAAHVVHMATNGLELDDEKAHGIVRAGLDELLVSIDAVDALTYKKIKGVGRYDEVEQNVLNLFRVRDKLGSRKPFVRLKIIRIKETEGEIGAFVKKWKGVADWIEIREYIKWGKGSHADAGVPPKRKRYACPYVWYMPSVNWNGDFSICCADYDCSGVVGNVYNASIHDIWHGEAIKKIREGHLCGDYGVAKSCKDCEVWVQDANIERWLCKLEGKASGKG